jgi:hypothetical protein
MFIPPLMTLLRPNVTGTFYSSKVMNDDWNMVQNPSAIYVASTNKTIVSWCAVGAVGDKASQVAEFNHATNTWSRRYNAGNYTLANDNHGHPAIIRDASGYIHIFYGSHGSVQHWSSTNNPDDITSWTQHTPMAGKQTYPHPTLIGSVIYLFLRNGDPFPREAPMSFRTCTPSSGTGTFSAQTTIIDLDTGGAFDGGRCYTSECHVIGTDVHFAFTGTDETDTYRRHVYYAVYKTATGALENHDASVSTASGSLPITLATADASYRLIDMGASGKGDVPSLTFDTNGDPHIVYSWNGGSGTTYNIYHITKSGGVWSTPVIVAGVDDLAPGTGTGTAYVSNVMLVPGPSGTVAVWYINTAGDKIRRERNASGVWSAPETIVVAGSLKLLGQQAVKDAHASFRSIFAEVVSGASSDAAAVPGKRYAHGDSGLIAFAMPAVNSVDPNWSSVNAMLGFDSRDGATRVINESDSGLVVTANGNAQIDTAQSQFGGASLLLDGTGDFLTIANNAVFQVGQGDFTVECWVRRNATKLQCVVAKKPSSGSSEWAMFINASNQLQCQAFDATVAVVNIISSATIALSTWTHVALSRSGTTWRQFINGVLDGSATQSGVPVLGSAARLIGRDAAFIARDFNGHIDEFRFTSGVARYTATFTAPVAAFPRI